MAILQLRAARSWSLEQTAKAFLVTAETIASWLKRVDEQGPDALVQLPVPVNRYPEFVRHVVQQLKSLCPMLGKMKIAQILARAGLHLGVATVGRILKAKPQPVPPAKGGDMASKKRVVTAKYPNHLWHTDLTVIPTARGFWTTWLPFTLPQCWPFAWWLALAEDHFSRRVMGYAVFLKEPSSAEVCMMLGRGIAVAGKAPRHIVCDHGPQFDCDGFRRWCRRKGIKPPRYGAIGKRGSLAVIERLILTLKTLLCCLPLVPLRRSTFHCEIGAAIDWYNEQRPHMTLGGRTPNEVYAGRFPANRKPHYEPREHWPRSSVCARPVTLVKGQPGARIGIHVKFASSRRHLPIVHVKRAA
jgi:putative transposase